MAYKIAVLPGDGIGPEVMDASLVVLQAAQDSVNGLELDLRSYEAGAMHYRATGTVMPDRVMAECMDADAVFLAAIGLPDVRQPDGTEVQPVMMVGLRREMDLHAAVRPIKLYRGAPSPLQNPVGIDFVIVRENLEGLFSSFGGGAVVEDQVATDTLVVTREGTTKVVDFAFQLARRRHGRPLDGQKVVTCVDKSNVFKSFALFRKVFFETAKQYRDVAAEATYVDAMSLYMVQQPHAYDVVVTENQFGDILSDLGAAIVGGLGLAPSAEIGYKRALFQPSHGSAPDIARKGIANPLATILSGAMMLDWLGQKNDDAAATLAAKKIEEAVSDVVELGSSLPADLGGEASTCEVGRAVAAAVASRATVS